MTELVDKFIGDAEFKAGVKLCGPVCGDMGPVWRLPGPGC